MVWEHISLTKAHIAYAVIAVFSMFFSLYSLFIKEKLYLGEAPLATIYGVIVGEHALNWFNPFSWGNWQYNTLEISRLLLCIEIVAVAVELPKKYVIKHWFSLFLLLIPGMTTGFLLIGLFIWAILPSVNFAEGLLISACITATDPVLAQAVVGKGKFAQRVPAHLRNLLNAESACNDGISVPFVFLALNLIIHQGHAGEIAEHWICISVLYECVFGAIFGAFLGWAGRKLLRKSESLRIIDSESFLSFYIMLATLCAGFGSILGIDDLLASFCAGTAFAWDGWFTHKTEESHVSTVIDLLLNLSYFVYFGSIIPWEQFNNHELGLDAWRMVCMALCVLVFRRIPAVLAMKRICPDINTWKEALFVGHFGPIGVGAVFTAIVAISNLEAEELHIKEGPTAEYPDDLTYYRLIRIVWPCVTFLIMTSILVHGSSVAVMVLGKHLQSMSFTLTFTRTETGGNWTSRLPSADRLAHGGVQLMEHVNKEKVGTVTNAVELDSELSEGSYENLTARPAGRAAHRRRRRQLQKAAARRKTHKRERQPRKHLKVKKNEHPSAEDEAGDGGSLSLGTPSPESNAEGEEAMNEKEAVAAQEQVPLQQSAPQAQATRNNARHSPPPAPVQYSDEEEDEGREGGEYEDEGEGEDQDQEYEDSDYSSSSASSSSTCSTCGQPYALAHPEDVSPEEAAAAAAKAQASATHQSQPQAQSQTQAQPQGSLDRLMAKGAQHHQDEEDIEDQGSGDEHMAVWIRGSPHVMEELQKNWDIVDGDLDPEVDGDDVRIPTRGYRSGNILIIEDQNGEVMREIMGKNQLSDQDSIFSVASTEIKRTLSHISQKFRPGVQKITESLEGSTNASAAEKPKEGSSMNVNKAPAKNYKDIPAQEPLPHPLSWTTHEKEDSQNEYTTEGTCDDVLSAPPTRRVVRTLTPELPKNLRQRRNAQRKIRRPTGTGTRRPRLSERLHGYRAGDQIIIEDQEGNIVGQYKINDKVKNEAGWISRTMRSLGLGSSSRGASAAPGGTLSGSVGDEEMGRTNTLIPENNTTSDDKRIEGKLKAFLNNPKMCRLGEAEARAAAKLYAKRSGTEYSGTEDEADEAEESSSEAEEEAHEEEEEEEEERAREDREEHEDSEDYYGEEDSLTEEIEEAEEEQREERAEMASQKAATKVKAPAKAHKRKTKDDQ